MKKIFLFTMLIIIMTSRVSAQEKHGGEIEIYSFSWGATHAAGIQTAPVPGGKGALCFNKQGERFTNVVFTDALWQNASYDSFTARDKWYPKTFL